MSEALLQLDQVTIRFGGLTAVSAVNLQISGNELIGLIGPNGAGKTTVFNLITGVYQPTEGAIRFNGQTTASLRPHQLARLGIARTFQNIRLFASMSVFDNVRTAAGLHHPHGIIEAVWRGRRFREGEQAIAHQVMELLEIFDGGRNGFTALNTAFGEYATLRIKKDTVADQPIEFNFAAEEGTAQFPRLIVIAEAGSKATIVESYASPSKSFTNSAIQIVVEDNANLTHYRVQKESPESFHYGVTEVSVGRGGGYNSTNINLGAA